MNLPIMARMARTRCHHCKNENFTDVTVCRVIEKDENGKPLKTEYDPSVRLFPELVGCSNCGAVRFKHLS